MLSTLEAIMRFCHPPLLYVSNTGVLVCVSSSYT